ncbi:unnamed protein product [Penicillium salamii]|uniref:Nucleoside phosphorylase domain-containing protein n=1 Tax=Penicillium salamii TaxID=1612424 RepID=A0A9W4JN01_9EURO|nr:unnamed protein product [Penicillium salamii]CAG7962745.1 unnamed protein product [Penicillium salamii]CAG8021925.1 unnamed protein product [Penicillium salamii]CAG8085654.1 unnamed protein product [Penicillium salamii]CAG8159523.1 unnamed protein product [Penicillium salamii]
MESSHFNGTNHAIQIAYNYGPVSADIHQSKRSKTSHHGGLPAPRHEQYTIAWICALHIEMAAAQTMLDGFHEALPTYADDRNAYVLGNIKEHNVVIACLPTEQYGTNNAAIVMTNLQRTFPAIRACFMVGIGGGVPTKADVRLGDIVVGTRVMQCDLGKVLADGQLQRTAIPRILDHSLGGLVSTVRSKHELSPNRVLSILEQRLREQPAYSRPDLPDRLFDAAYDHETLSGSCEGCDPSKLVRRGTRASNEVVIHYGAIASGNQVMRDGKTRDIIARQLDIICFEMEAAGLMDILPCLAIRGICDYSDSHKNKEWQRYAAATAAAYARELLEELPVTRSHAEIASAENSDHSSVSERRKSLLDSLKFEQMDARKTTIKQEQKKTCRWFLKHPSYKAWLDPAELAQHHGFLWMSGKPGAGKSTIMKFAYGNMKSKTRQKDAMTASFFFNARGDTLEKTISGMYRSLLLQLLEGYPDLQAVLDDPDQVPRNQTGCPSLNVLKNLFANAISALGQRSLVCFVDALDECDEQQVVDMVQYFEDLTEDSTAKGVRFRICFSSRHYPYIFIRRGLRLTLEDQSGHADDLETYVTSRLLIQEPALVEKLQPKLFKKAAGVFMWVVLVVDILNTEYRRGRMALERRLEEIPSDLSALFKDILRRDNEDMEALKLCILWILFAKKPLQLQEFYHAIWSGLSLGGSGDDQIPDVTVLGTGGASDMFKRYVISSSKGLAETTKSDQPRVQFIHESVRDFLIKDNGLYELWPELGLDCEGLGHETLKHCCDLYANNTTVRTSVDKLPAEPTSENKNGILQKYPFLEYVTQNILHHANAAAKAVPQDEFLSCFHLSEWIKVSNMFEKFKTRRYTPKASLLYVLANGGYPALIRARTKNDAEINVFGERYKYPLLAALANGHKDAVAALLNSPSRICDGVDITEGLNHRKDLREYANRTPLSWASQNGHVGIVKLLLQTGIPCDEEDKDVQTPLSLALIGGHATIARLLIDKGADTNARDMINRLLRHKALKVNHEKIAPLLIDTLKINFDIDAIDENGRTLLQRAADPGYEAIVRFLIAKEADVNTRNRVGQTPLYTAVESGRVVVAKLLIEKGAHINIVDKDGLTLLHTAIKNDNTAMAKLLIKNGAHSNAIDKDGRTPLHLASSNGHKEVSELLTEREADLNAVDRDGRTPLHLASSVGHKAIAELLVNEGADLNAIDNDGRTPLHLASSNGHGAVSGLLTEKETYLDIIDKDGRTPLHLASLKGDWPISEDLIDRGADLNVVDNDGRTPLHLASSTGNKMVSELLAKKMVDLDITDKDGLTPLHLALSNGHAKIAKFLIDNGAHFSNEACDKDGRTYLQRASNAGYEAVVRLLITTGADINARDKNGRTPFLGSLANYHEAIARLLLESGASFNHSNGWSPLQRASSQGHQAIVKLLIERGADVNARDSDQRTALQLAAARGHRTVVVLLIESGAIDDSYGSTALQLASANGHEAIVKLLIERGADVNVKDSDQRTALQLASANGHKAIVKLLIEKGARAEREN